jgi:hypothetical protein
LGMCARRKGLTVRQLAQRLGGYAGLDDVVDKLIRNCSVAACSGARIPARLCARRWRWRGREPGSHNRVPAEQRYCSAARSGFAWLSAQRR